MTTPSLSLVLKRQVTLMSSSKHGPVMFTIVPPNMWPFSGAKVRGRFVPTAKQNQISAFAHYIDVEMLLKLLQA